MRFDSNEFQSALTSLCACLHRDASDIDEVLATTARIEDGDADSWVLEWIATAGEVWARANAEARAGRRESALACFRRAASYYDAALALIARSAECDRRLQVWRRQRTCWERVVDLLPARGERITIPYLGTTLPGYFFAAPCRGRRPLVIMNNGSVSCTSQMWVRGGAAAAERGYHWMTFDGPGQQSALIERASRLVRRSGSPADTPQLGRCHAPFKSRRRSSAAAGDTAIAGQTQQVGRRIESQPAAVREPNRRAGRQPTAGSVRFSLRRIRGRRLLRPGTCIGGAALFLGGIVDALADVP
jgi:tetratricopeptide (TPR) repeat protein